MRKNFGLKHFILHSTVVSTKNQFTGLEPPQKISKLAKAREFQLVIKTANIDDVPQKIFNINFFIYFCLFYWITGGNGCC